jgi:hypothetical protein
MEGQEVARTGSRCRPRGWLSCEFNLLNGCRLLAHPLDFLRASNHFHRIRTVPQNREIVRNIVREGRHLGNFQAGETKEEQPGEHVDARSLSFSRHGPADCSKNHRTKGIQQVAPRSQ